MFSCVTGVASADMPALTAESIATPLDTAWSPVSTHNDTTTRSQSLLGADSVAGKLTRDLTERNTGLTSSSDDDTGGSASATSAATIFSTSTDSSVPAINWSGQTTNRFTGDKSTTTDSTTPQLLSPAYQMQAVAAPVPASAALALVGLGLAGIVRRCGRR